MALEAFLEDDCNLISETSWHGNDDGHGSQAVMIQRGIADWDYIFNVMRSSRCALGFHYQRGCIIRTLGRPAQDVQSLHRYLDHETSP